ncbi:MAG: NAD-dependent epimerase/dehydratase family protein [Candidatus Diapherotrites archaeon]|nr:NAD-dependent epimerase/dehydratase family protein [Candidatus Diapherotrites archaeon]
MSLVKVLVTGSSGMIGTRLCERLLENGFAVVGADIAPNQWSERIDSLTVRTDLRNAAEVQRLPRDVDCVVHLAANARVYDLVVRPEDAFDNTLMTFNLLEFVRKNSIPRFIFASSREVYGNQDKTQYAENEARVEYTESPYAASKLASESLAWSYHRCYGIDIAILRFSNVYGMYDNSNRLIPQSIAFIHQNKSITVYGAEKALDFTYIDDAVQGVLLLIEKFDAAKNNTFNISFGKEEAIESVVQKLRKLLHARNEVETAITRPGEVALYRGDVSKAKRLLGFHPTTGIDEGLAKTVKWYNAHP